MLIPRIDFLIFGYRKITIEEKDLKNALNLFLKTGLSVKIENSSFLISEKEYKRIESLISGKISCSVSEPLGLFGVLQKYKMRFGISLALLLSIFLCTFASSRVWDIRIDGASPEKEEEILTELSELGFSVGTPFRKIDKAKIEAEMLSVSENVSWININQRGTVAYIKVIEKLSYEEELKSGYANIVATRDCVIEEIILRRGVALVKAGETVKKGQILISGVIPAELGGGFCYAEGEVIGRYLDEISLVIPQTETQKKVVGREIYRKNINFFNFSLKFFKNYRKTETECDIIKEKRKFLSFFGKKLPLSREYEWRVFYEEYDVSYTKDEMIRLGAKRMRDALNRSLSDKTLLKLRTRGEFSDGNYIIATEYVATSEVGVALEFHFFEGKTGD